MFKHVLMILVIAASVSLATVCAGEMTILEEAAEFERLNASVSENGRGSLKAKVCDECKELRLKIAPGTQLEVNGKQRPLKELNKGALNGGTVFFNPETLTVLRISGSR